jgi:eukaryotic-like serine/threonine-protein kinase
MPQESTMSEKKHPWEGQRVNGRFELGSYLGGTASSFVFATARDGQTAAIKIVRLNGEAADKQLANWARAANPSHPNLLPIFESGRCRIGGVDSVYIVMERADEALAEILPQRALTAAEASEMLPPILDALKFLHGQGLCHGRMKPANVLAVGDKVKISSDSVAATGTRASDASAYDAPEVAASGCSQAADMWSLGITLIEALTQQNPARSTIGVVPAIPSEAFRDIAEHCVQRDAKTRWTIADVMSRMSPDWREPQPEIASTAVRQVPKPVPIVAKVPSKQSVSRPSSTTIRPRKTAARWRAFIPAAAIVVIAVIAVIAAPKILNRSQSRQSEAASLPSATPATADQPPVATAPKAAVETTRTEKPETPAATSSGAATPQPSSPEFTPTAPTEKPTPAAATVRPAIEAAPSEGDVVDRVIPSVPQKALDTIHGTVKISIRVQIDAAGNVSDASFESEGPSQYFANLAMKAAREWKFTPASGSRESILRFQITPAGTKVTETPARP